MKNNTVSVVVVSLLILGGILFLALKSFKKKPFKGTPKDTVVTIAEFSAVKSGFATYYQFECNEKMVLLKGGGRIMHAVVGEKFRAIYDENNCKNVRIFYDQPLFLNDEDTNEAEGVITGFSSGKVHFKYTVGDKTFKKLQFLEDNFRKENPQIQEGNKFRVQFWLQNPQRAILLLPNK